MTTRRQGKKSRLAGLFVLFALMTIGGCGDSEAPTATTAPGPTATPASTGDTTAMASTSTGAEQHVVLRHDGLGVVMFGQPVDTVI
jgi:hypothetical protein